MAPDTRLDPATLAATTLGLNAAGWRLLTAEASPRRYFRAAQGAEGWLLVVGADAPHATTDFLREIGIRVPRLGASAPGCYLVQDFGDRHLAHAPDFRRYNQLLEDWLRFSFAELPEDHPNRGLALDLNLFQRELRQFADSYLHDWRGLDMSPEAWQACHQALAEGAREAASGPTSLQHRDFHSRNLLLPDAAAPVWLDHQDLRRGPVFYDLASLITDAYLDLDRALLRRLEEEAELLGRSLGLSSTATHERLQAVTWQRLLKALGTFGKLLTAGRLEYRDMEARALAHVARLSAAHPPPPWVQPLLPYLQAPEDAS